MTKIVVYLLMFMHCFCIANSYGQTRTFMVSGYVKDVLTQTSLRGASIKPTEGKAKGVITDSLGYFTLKLPAGYYTLNIGHVGFVKKAMAIHITANTTLTIDLMPEAKELDAVVVTSSENRNKVASTQSGMESMDRKLALTLPAILGEVDIIKLLQMKPGVKNSGEGTSGLSVRGGGTDQNLFLLDGTTVYNPNHLFGFFSTFNIDAIKDVQLYKAGFPAEFSGRLSSVVDVNTLRADDSAFSISGGIGLIASRVNMQANLLKKKKGTQKLSMNLAARRTYADIFTQALNEANKNDSTYNPIPTYYFYDLNARFDFIASTKDHFFASVYYGRDFFKFNSETFKTTFSWGNTAVAVHWKHTYTSHLNLVTSFHFSDYNYLLRSSFDRFNFNIKSGINDVSLRSKVAYTGLEKHVVKAGIDATINRFAISKFTITSSRENENLTSGEGIHAQEGGAFVDDEWEITDKLKLNTGLRFSVFKYQKTYTGVEPRMNARYSITPQLAIKTSYARMVQYKHLVASSGASLPTDIWYPSTKNILPEISDQGSIGYTYNFHDKFLLTHEAYYKQMRRLVDYKPGANLFVNDALEDEFVFGKGKSYGTEITLEKTAGKLRGWLGYTLAWTTRTFATINNGATFYPRFDRRHELSLVATYQVSKRVTASASWTLYTGNAVSLPTGRSVAIDVPGVLNNNAYFNFSPVYDQRGNYRMPTYHRLDLGVVWKLKPKRGSSDITFSAYNAYSRLNAYFISFESKEGPTSTAGTPAAYSAKAITLFPIIPSVTYNFKF